ncbi:MAG: NUDIX domain-containing protein [Chloroflexia bacterium]|nr:NUDIX domain-containing protein [Chloroflexia bacterium]
MIENTRVPRLSARALLFDDSGRLVLVRRSRPGQASYLTTPGGGVEPGESLEAAAARECGEELGAEVIVGPTAYVRYVGAPVPGIQTFFLSRLERVDPRLRTGHELSEPERGDYETVHVNWSDPEQIATLQPEELHAVLRDHGAYLARKATGLAGSRPPRRS